MSVETTITSKNLTYGVPGVFIVDYTCPGIEAGVDSTALLDLELPGIELQEKSYRYTPVVPSLLNNGGSYVIELLTLNVSCSSANYTLRLLNKDDITLINTVNEVFRSAAITTLSYNNRFDNLFIANKDTPMDNKLYLYISNSGIATGDIYVELLYRAIQDRQF